VVRDTEWVTCGQTFDLPNQATIGVRNQGWGIRVIPLVSEVHLAQADWKSIADDLIVSRHGRLVRDAQGIGDQVVLAQVTAGTVQAGRQSIIELDPALIIGVKASPAGGDR